MIGVWGQVPLPDSVVQAADLIKHLNYKTTTPARFQKNHLLDVAGAVPLMENVAAKIGLPREQLDYVYFSACKGAEPHTDLLDPARFEPRTFIIPVILPPGESVLHAQGATRPAELGVIYEFDHEKVHGMTVEDEESGCVVIMVAVKR